MGRVKRERVRVLEGSNRGLATWARAGNSCRGEDKLAVGSMQGGKVDFPTKEGSENPTQAWIW